MSSIDTHTPRRLTIVGGGYSACTAAAQFARASAVPIAITIVEPRETLGQGLAYSSTDPDHRLNGTLDVHMLDPADPDSLQRWCDEQRILEHDPEARVADGSLFIRRSDFGRYLNATLRGCAERMPTASIRHIRDRAVDAVAATHGLDIILSSGQSIASDMVIVATGNAAPRLPSHVSEALANHPRVLQSMSDVERLQSIPSHARVLVLGSGLTALDAISSLLRREHHGEIVAVSRRGLRPRPYRPKPAVVDRHARPALERIDGPVAPFIADLVPLTLSRLVRALRVRIQACERDGQSWYVAFDELRDVLWQFWPAMPAGDKRRFLRLLRTWYDVHRFRAPPQNDTMVRDAERRGRVAFKAARVCNASWAGGDGPIRIDLCERGAHDIQRQTFDAVINCTGLDTAATATDNPFLASMLQRGLLSIDASGVGFAVDGQCRPLGQNGLAHEQLRVIGPPTAGVFGDPLGALFIAAQVRRMLPCALVALSAI